METLLINGTDVRNLLTIRECINGVEQAFKLRALGQAHAPAILGIPSKDGGFHIKAGVLNLGREYFVSKANANFPLNRKRNALPTIQGIIVVSDALDGRLLALMDSIEITIIRTGAATAVAAKYLSNPLAETLTIIGCGNQGRISVQAIKAVRMIKKVYLYDLEEKIAHDLKRQLGSDHPDLTIEVVSDFGPALATSDIVVTCTPSKKPFIHQGDLKPGTFIAAVGSDNEDKQEIDSDLLPACTIVVDSIDQASTIGELRHAINSGFVKRENVFSELGEIIAGSKSFNYTKEQIVLFDSTGTALQDVAASVIVYEKAVATNSSARFVFASPPGPLDEPSKSPNAMKAMAQR